MPILQYETRVSPEGYITLPPIPEYQGRKVVVQLDTVKDENQPLDDGWQVDPARILPNGKTAVDDFLDFCKELNLPPLTDEKCDQLREERITGEQARIADQSPEEWQAAIDDFMTSWKGCLKGVPHMTAKEIRAERLEKKYGGEK